MRHTLYDRRTKRIAILLLGVFVFNLLQPLSAFALTSGPGQPESQSFQPVGVSDMVDLNTGDFKYNIPLLDVDGYPLNLNYQSGVGMDDEASWVGLGWNLNVGAISRQLRGLPDDFAGDQIITDHYTKPKITVGGRITAKVETLGKARLSGSFSFGVFSDNYTGVGAELGVNAGMSFSLANDGALTAGLGIGVLSNTSSGVDITPNISLSIGQNTNDKITNIAGLTSSLGYNSRSGLKTLSLGSTYKSYKAMDLGYSFNTEAVMPKVQIPYKSSYGSFSLDVGGVAFGLFLGIGGTGYQSVREIEKESHSNPAYGFLYADQGKDNKNALMDFIREKENPVIPELPNLALPVHTPDIFTYNSQTGSGQFRLFRGGTGVFFDNESADRSTVTSVGGDLGIGGYVHTGFTLFNQNTSNKTSKWRTSNNYLKNGDFQGTPKTDPGKPQVFFRKVDEKNIEDDVLNDKLGKSDLLSVSISGKVANSAFVTKTDFTSSIKPFLTPIAKNIPQIQNTMISYLTAGEAKVAGLNRTIDIYPFNDYGSFNLPGNHEVRRSDTASREDLIKKKHHISEITVTSNDGQRAIYGLPVYNIKQEEYSFALDPGYNSKDGVVAIGSNGIERKKGIDHYYHKDTHGAYAYSYLLTGLLSPDYSAKNIDSVNVDDKGTAIKFRYSKIPKFKWRTPYNNKINSQTVKNTAALNRGLLADPDDDKGSIVYGEKEIYYVHSIESKNKIAYFITEDRQDGLGVTGINGTIDPSVRQKCLKEIRLYSKFNMSKPIKVVKFDYSYELCPGTPNSIAEAVPGKALAQGKLTLKRVWFEYGATQKGFNHPYIFSYNNTIGGATINYANMQTDRWGTYKSPSNNQGNLTNEEFPYSDQDRMNSALNAGLWHIQSIHLPSGGEIQVSYEADDYAYVQNKRAMVMVPFEMINKPGSLVGTQGIRVALDSVPSASVSDFKEWFKKTYLNGSDYIYTKSHVKISTGNAPSAGQDNDFVPSYCKVSNVIRTGDLSNPKADIILEQVNAAGVMVNPIRFAAWQRLKNEYPRYAYPGFQNRVGDQQNGIEAAVKAIITSASNLSELKENFYQKANRKGYASVINSAKSFAKIVKTSGFKIGGGVRVNKITISDNWDEFTGDNVPKGTYGQSYDYTVLDNGKRISSGVATYEPSIGNDENALKQPVPYVQKIKGAINNYFELEEPFGESFYPSPSIGYSRVTVRDLEPDGRLLPRTGSVVNEFYTAKDFPVRVKVSNMQTNGNPKPISTYSLVKTQSIEEKVLSQGYRIELNDMHGKLRSNRILNHAGAEISSTEYFYKVDDPKSPEPKLNNNVKVIGQDGIVRDKVMGVDIELFTDFREQETNNIGIAVNIGLDVIPFFWFPLPIPHFPSAGNNEYKLFRSACAVKVVQTNGLVSRVVKKENGSSIAVENVAYDGITGEALITKTENEFKKSYYSVNLPAYWVYKGMGPAYQTLGGLLQNLNAGTSGAIVNSTYSNYLMAGDELIDVSSGAHYWVIETAGAKRLIDEKGFVKTVNISMAKVIRSGYRNVLQPPTSTLVCMENPIVGSQFKLATNNDLSSLKVISTSTNLFDEKWSVEKIIFPSGIIENENTNHCFTFISGSITDGYGINGTIMEGTGNLHLISRYWGGEACSEINPTRLKSDSTIQRSLISTNSAPPIYTGVCNRFESGVPNTSYACWPLNRCGIWLAINQSSNLDEWIGFEKELTINTSNTYYFGMGADNEMKVFVDDVKIWDTDQSPINRYNYWTLKPYHFDAGKHMLRVEFLNRYKDGVNNSNNPAAAGLEIYNTDYASIASNIALNPSAIIFSTQSLRNATNTQSFRTINGVRVWHYTYNNLPSPVMDVNPFVSGYLGNWRPSQTKVYQETRKYVDVFNPASKSMDIKNAGYFNSFNPWWKYQNGLWIENSSVKWITANTVTLYDKYGQELENKDALGRYSAASFDFNGQLPASVASNAMNREIYANSFEDTKFRVSNNPIPLGEFFNASIDGSMFLLVNTNQSHSGNYSLNLDLNGIFLNTNIHSERHKTIDYLSSDASGYKQKNILGLYPSGFAPLPNQKYIISTWVKDAQPKNRSINISIAIKGQAGSAIQVPLTCKAIVEGWKLLEGEINTGSVIGDKLQITMKSIGATVNIDDLRIHPKEAHMKSYAYDNKNFKLMAELDENAFATFYEYDDEGSLVRVKKETDRGVMTIKENRSSYRKNTIQ